MAHRDAPSNSDDIIDSRDVIARIEELEDEREHAVSTLESASGELPDGTIASMTEQEAKAALDRWDEDWEPELKALVAFMEEMKGNGGDEQWRGDWYPVTIIRDSYFEDYAEELAKDIGAISRDAQWPLGCIDWEKAADELKQDYTSVDFDGVEYWVR